MISFCSVCIQRNVTGINVVSAIKILSLSLYTYITIRTFGVTIHYIEWLIGGRITVF